MEPSGGEQEPGAVRLLDLPWEDVLLPHILSRIPLRQLLHLQRVSKAFQALVQLHLARLRSFDSAQDGKTGPSLLKIEGRRQRQRKGGRKRKRERKEGRPTEDPQVLNLWAKDLWKL